LGVKQPRPWLDRAAVIDPERHFVTVEFCTAKGSFALMLCAHSELPLLPAQEHTHRRAS